MPLVIASGKSEEKRAALNQSSLGSTATGTPHSWDAREILTPSKEDFEDDVKVLRQPLGPSPGNFRRRRYVELTQQLMLQNVVLDREIKDHEVVIAGPLQQRFWGFLWRWRWCVLKGTSLFVYRDEEEPIPASPAPSQRRSRSPAEGDEALDVIASLEGLWLDSRKDTARRLMRASISSMTSQNSVSSTSSLQGHATAMPHLLRLESSHSGNISDSDSESSSRQSVSTSTSITGSQAEKLPPFMSHGVHLEWKLKMHPRPPKDVQVSRQRGLCPECRERLPSSLFHGPRYCHYLGYYFCTNCHNGDIRVIPARVAERWDFEPRKVCSAVAKYLDLQVNQALVPITSIRQTKVSSQQILTEIHTFRQKLSRIKGVVADYGCSFQEELSHSLAQLDAHVARGHDFYAMQDLIRIEIQGKNCPLYTNISRCVMDCAKHIHSCPTCSQCAEQCPICASPTPVYPFEIETFHACNKCKKAFHKACFRRAGSSCPFCLEGSTVSHAVSLVQAR